MKKFTLEWKPNNYWNMGQLVVSEDGIEKERIPINCFYSIEADWFYIYSVVGGSGTGHKPGEIIRKIDMRGAEYKKVELR